MIDLHTHTVFSDGVLIPAELARRAKVMGYQCLAVTDHVDFTNLSWIVNSLSQGVKKMISMDGLDLIVGVEITHVPPPLIDEVTQEARRLGADLVLVHGETLVEPVEEGTNLAAIEAGVDILAHPGLISCEEVSLAAKNKVALEITTRKGHCLTNGHVAALSRQYGGKLVINNDTHAPEDLVSRELRKMIALGAGLSEEEYFQIERNSWDIVQRILASTG